MHKAIIKILYATFFADIIVSTKSANIDVLGVYLIPAVQQLDNPRYPLPTADACRYHAILFLPATEFVYDLDGKLRAGAAERMGTAR